MMKVGTNIAAVAPLADNDNKLETYSHSCQISKKMLEENGITTGIEKNPHGKFLIIRNLNDQTVQTGLETLYNKIYCQQPNRLNPSFAFSK